VRSDWRVVYNSVYADGLERWFSLFPAQSFVIWVSMATLSLASQT
jgi:hypothetical protein